MNEEDLNKLIDIRNEIYHISDKSECLCEECKETLKLRYEELRELIDKFALGVENE